MELRAETYERIWAVFRKYRTLLFHRAKSVAGETELAEETLEDALVRMLERAERLSDLTEAQLLAYAAATVHNVALDAAQMNGRRVRMELPLAEETGPDTGPAVPTQSSVEERYVRSEDRELVRRAVQRLSESERELIIRHYYLEESYEEIGAQLDIRTETVRVQVFRVRKKLLKLLGEEGYTHE